jgi:glyceraldehyde 3-phosphate dehydrogenase
MKTKIGINGFGRIGRNILKIISQNHNEKLEVVAINDLTDTKTLAHLLKYDSLFGKFKGPIKALENSIVVNGNEIKVFRERNPENIDWKSLNAEIVIESTGIFTKKEQAQVHITKGGAKKVLISAPAKNDDVTIVLGVNENEYNPQEHNIISNASCTTNCLATVVKVLDDNYKIKNGFMTTVHSYTNDQNILDLPHKDLRRARAAALSIIPTKTGAAKSIGRVIPNLNKKLDGFAFRVPTATVSVLDLTLNIEKKTSKDDINNLFIDVSNGYMKGILDYTDEELVSIDFKENPASAVIDLLSTNVIDNTIKVLAWYDNEWGYSNRCVDLAVFIAEKGL